MNMNPKNWLRKLLQPAPVTLNYLIDSDGLIEVQECNGCLSLLVKEDILIAPQSYYTIPTGIRLWGDYLILMSCGSGMMGSDPDCFDLILSNPAITVGFGIPLWVNCWNPNDSVFAIESGDEIVSFYAVLHSPIILNEVHP